MFYHLKGVNFMYTVIKSIIRSGLKSAYLFSMFLSVQAYAEVLSWHGPYEDRLGQFVGFVVASPPDVLNACQEGRKGAYKEHDKQWVFRCTVTLVSRDQLADSGVEFYSRLWTTGFYTAEEFVDFDRRDFQNQRFTVQVEEQRIPSGAPERFDPIRRIVLSAGASLYENCLKSECQTLDDFKEYINAKGTLILSNQVRGKFYFYRKYINRNSPCYPNRCRGAEGSRGGGGGASNTGGG